MGTALFPWGCSAVEMLVLCWFGSSVRTGCAEGVIGFSCITCCLLVTSFCFCLGPGCSFGVLRT